MSDHNQKRKFACLDDDSETDADDWNPKVNQDWPVPPTYDDSDDDNKKDALGGEDSPFFSATDVTTDNQEVDLLCHEDLGDEDSLMCATDDQEVDLLCTEVEKLGDSPIDAGFGYHQQLMPNLMMSMVQQGQQGQMPGGSSAVGPVRQSQQPVPLMQQQLEHDQLTTPQNAGIDRSMFPLALRQFMEFWYARMGQLPISNEVNAGFIGDRTTDNPDLFNHLRGCEIILPDYIVTSSMREILIETLAEVAGKWKLDHDIIFRTTSYIDIFLSSKSIDKERLLLLGATCMMIASKYEDASEDNIAYSLCQITGYTKQEMVAMEAIVLEALKFKLSHPTVYTFLRMLFHRVDKEKLPVDKEKLPDQVSVLEEEEVVHVLARYLLELSMTDYDCCITYFPSQIAASALFLSKFTIDPTLHPWTKLLEQYSEYKPSYLKPCILLLQDLQMRRRGEKVHKIREKYSGRVADLVSGEIPPVFLNDLKEIFLQDLKE